MATIPENEVCLMGVTFKKTNNIPRLTKILKELGKSEIQVGVFGEDSNVDEEPINMVTLARVHEYGMTIKPKRAKFLTVPINKAAKGKRAADFPDSFIVKGREGISYIARKKGKKGKLDLLFMLLPSITIPERSFLRSGFDENVDKITNKIARELNRVLRFQISVDVFLDAIGEEFAGLIKKKMRRVGPPNHWATVATKGSSAPLRDDGRLIQSVRHKVVEADE